MHANKQAAAPLTRRSFLQTAAAAGALGCDSARAAPAAFTPDWHSLASGYLAADSALAPGAIDRVEVVGGESLPFTRTRSGLEVRLPDGLAGTIAVALKIRGGGLA